MEDIEPKFDLNQTVVEKIIAIRDSLHLNQRQFADLLNLSPSVISKIESGKQQLNLNFIQHISEKTNKSIDEILEVKGNVYNVEHQKGLQNQCTNPTLHINLSPEQFEGLKDILK